MRALNFGSLNIDYVYSVPHGVKAGETLSASSMQIFCGGKGLNQSIALAKAGVEVYHAGNIGTDGSVLTELLKANGIDTSFTEKRDGSSGHAVIQVDANGQNSILVYGGANKAATDSQIKRVLSHFGKGDCLFLQNETNCVSSLIKTGYERGMTVVLNPSPITDDVKTYPLELLSWLVINETEGKELTEQTDGLRIIEVLGNRYPNVNILLTLGSRGSLSKFNGEIYSQKAYSVKAVDTTAAGDTFTGFFFAFLEEKGVIESLKIASAASAVAVSRKGASDSVPAVCEVEDFLEANN